MSKWYISNFLKSYKYYCTISFFNVKMKSYFSKVKKKNLKNHFEVQNIMKDISPYCKESLLKSLKNLHNSLKFLNGIMTKMIYNL